MNAGSATFERQDAKPRLLLASRSPRRQELLRRAGYAFSIEPPDIDERALPAHLTPSDIALHIARQKSRDVSDRFPRDVVLAADTVIVFAERVIGKPTDADDARRIIQLLAGTTHIVITGISVRHGERDFTQDARVLSAVRMKSFTPNEIDRYIAAGQWQGKAGGYGLQDANPHIEKVNGCPTNVIGLPMTTTKKLLHAAGIEAAAAA